MKKVLFLTAPVIVLGLMLFFFWQKNRRGNLQSVIEHYQKQNNPDKLKAAIFLVENVSSHHSLSGKSYNEYVDVYKKLRKIPSRFRNDSLNIFFKKIDTSKGLRKKYDQEHLSAKYLINHIDNVYFVWQQCPWKDQIKFEIFCKYVLPYRVENEKATNWLPEYRSRFADMLKTIHFEGGPHRYKAIKQAHKIEEELQIEDLDSSTLVKLRPGAEGLHFLNINQREAGRKMLIVRYTTGMRHSIARFIINDTDTITQTLFSTASLYAYPNWPTQFPVNLKKGLNTINVTAVDDMFALDYIDIAPIEEFYRDNSFYDLIDGGNYYIENALSKKKLTYAKHFPNRFSYLQCIDKETPLLQKFNIQNIDFGYFNIYPHQISPNFVLGFSGKTSDSLGVWADSLTGNTGLWATIPVAKNKYKIVNRTNGKCIEALKNTDKISLTEYTGDSSQHWNFIRADQDLTFDSSTHIPQNTPLEYACRVKDYLNFEWLLMTQRFPSLPATDILSTMTGNCKEESEFLLYALRSLGIPAALDFNPQRPNSAIGHQWNAIISNNKTIFYQFGLKPGTGMPDTPVAKIYRKTFLSDSNSLFFKKREAETIPELFNSPHIMDVTSEYVKTFDTKIKLSLNRDLAKNQHSYLCVFDNKKWYPITWSTNFNNTVTFKKIGTNVLYLPALYSSGKIIPIALPFILHPGGQIEQIIPDTNRLQTLKLYRKYLWEQVNHQLDTRMNGGKFEGANKPDFSDAITIYTHRGKTEPVFYTVNSNKKDKFKYLRYIGADGTHSTINEIIFFDHDGKEICGRVIGSEGSFKQLGNTKEKAFDKNILTYFDGVRLNGTWPGLELSNPTRVGKIRFIPRNDGNCVEIGDLYELVYWDKDGWKSLGRQIAQKDYLVFSNCPRNALFLLHNKTKGNKERIFTIDKSGKQVWW